MDDEKACDGEPLCVGNEHRSAYWREEQLDFATFRVTLLAKKMDRLTIRELARRYDLSYPQWRVIMWLGVASEQVTVGILAERGWVDRAEVSRAASSLETRGLIEKKANPADRRTPLMSLTSKGKDLFKVTLADRQQFHRNLLADLSVDEQALFDSALEKIRGRLDAM